MKTRGKLSFCGYRISVSFVQKSESSTSSPFPLLCHGLKLQTIRALILFFFPLQDFTVDMYFRQFWQDKRLEFERRPTLENLVVGAEYIHQIWTPDTFFVNEKTAYFHEATTENQFLRILHDGNVLRSIR